MTIFATTRRRHHEPSFPVTQVFFHQPANPLHVLVHRLFRPRPQRPSK